MLEYVQRASIGALIGAQGPYVILVGLLVLVTVLAEVVLVIVVLEVLLVEILLIHLLEGEGLPGEPVNGAGDQLLLDVLTELVVELEALLNVGGGIIILLTWCVGWGEEVEERLGGNGLLDDTRLFCVYFDSSQPACDISFCRDSDLLLLRCFFCSTLTVRSLPSFQLILSPSAWS